MSYMLLLGAAAEMQNWNIATEMRKWNAAKVFSYKEIKAATNNFKEVIGRGSFGSVYLGKLRDGKLVAVKVRFDKSQLGADSFINEVHYLNSSLYTLDSLEKWITLPVLYILRAMILLQCYVIFFNIMDCF